MFPFVGILRLLATNQLAHTFLQIFEIEIDVADAVFVIDQIRIHQGVAQDHEAVIAFISIKRGRIQAERIEDAAHFDLAERLSTQGRHRAKELLGLQGMARIGADVIVQTSDEGIGAAHAGIAARIQGKADQVAVRLEWNQRRNVVAVVGSETRRTLMESFGGKND